MDLSRGRFLQNRGRGQVQGDITQIDKKPQQGPRPKNARRCYNCNKPGHFTTECCAPKCTQACQAYIQDYMDQEEDLSNIQQALHPSNLLDNVLKVFDALPLKQKDALIAQYEGK
jgi:hypothetical protein